MVQSLTKTLALFLMSLIYTTEKFESFMNSMKKFVSFFEGVNNMMGKNFDQKHTLT